MATKARPKTKPRRKISPVERAAEVLTSYLSRGQLEKFVALSNSDREAAVTEALRQSKLI